MHGVDVREMLHQHELRDRIGLGSSKRKLIISGTIRSNLTYGAPEAADEELEEVIRVAQAKEFIDQKEERFDDGNFTRWNKRFWWSKTKTCDCSCYC